MQFIQGHIKDRKLSWFLTSREFLDTQGSKANNPDRKKGGFMEEYLLWAFQADSCIIITRGRTEDEAKAYAMKNAPPREEMVLIPFNSVGAAVWYNMNHPFDWLHTPPHYLKK